MTEVSSPTLKDDLIVFNEEEYHCYMVQCLDYGDPLAARETGEEMSNELAEMEREDTQRDTRCSTTRSGGKARRRVCRGSWVVGRGSWVWVWVIVVGEKTVFKKK